MPHRARVSRFSVGTHTMRSAKHAQALKRRQLRRAIRRRPGLYDGRRSGRSHASFRGRHHRGSVVPAPMAAGALEGMLGYEDVLYDVATDGVATLTINRPERMNALRPQTTRELRE